MIEAGAPHDYKVDGAIYEAGSLRLALAERAERRAQNGMNIVKKLAAHTKGELSLPPRKKVRLEQALDFLITYADRHPTTAEAVQTHVLAKFGLNYETLIWTRRTAQPR